MKRLSARTWLALAIDGVLIVCCVAHLSAVRDVAQTPFVVKNLDGRVVVTEILLPPFCPDLRVGDELVGMQDRRAVNPSVVQFLARESSIDQWVNVEFRREGITQGATVRLMPAFGVDYVILVAVIGIVTFCLAAFVLLMRPQDVAAYVLHWAMQSMAVVVVIGFDEVIPQGTLGYASSVLFFVSYAGVATTTFLFTMMFPRIKRGSTRLKLLATTLPAVALLLPIIYHHSRAVASLSVEEFVVFRGWFDLFYLFLFIYIAGSLFNVIHSYITSESTAERKQLKWILWGLCAGPTPFLLLTILPTLIAPEYSLPEEYTLTFLVIIPIAFAISCIKYRALDVEVVINRTTAYALVLGILAVVYLLVVGGVASFIANATASASAAVVVALLFQPVRSGVQRFVDRRFFRVRYDFRQAQRRVLEEIKYCLDVRHLGDVIVEGIERVIPVERLGFFTLKSPGDRVHLVAHKGFDLLETHGVPFDAAHLKTGLQLPVGVPDRVEPGVLYESADVDVFRRWGMVLVFAMLSEKQDLLGFLVLGEKKSGARFTSEDIDLLNNIATQAGLAIERLTLQQQLVLKQAETERLEGLNRLKSDFVSFVSHELKTPLTSIKMFSELLQSRQKAKDGKTQEYLQIIEGEADRLDRMVTTILDSAKIEQGVKEYQFSRVDLREVAEHVLQIMKYQLDKHRFRVDFKSGKSPLFIHADADAVAQAMINLISNAIKYSSHTKTLRVSLTRDAQNILCTVQDRGVGISAEAIGHLFEKFYRDPAQSRYVQGVGLGLPLVKHIMDAHGGNVDVRSEVGKGSTFILSFPKSKQDHESEKENPDR